MIIQTFFVGMKGELIGSALHRLLDEGLIKRHNRPYALSSPILFSEVVSSRNALVN